MPDIHKQNLILLPKSEYTRARSGKVFADNYWLATADDFLAFCLTPNGCPAAQCNMNEYAVEELLFHIDYPVSLEVKKIDMAFIPSYDNEIYWLNMRRRYSVAALEKVSMQEIIEMRERMGSDGASATDREIAALINAEKAETSSPSLRM